MTRVALMQMSLMMSSKLMCPSYCIFVHESKFYCSFTYLVHTDRSGPVLDQLYPVWDRNRSQTGYNWS